jgi:hypothetical protein
LLSATKRRVQELLFGLPWCQVGFEEGVNEFKRCVEFGGERRCVRPTHGKTASTLRPIGAEHRHDGMTTRRNRVGHRCAIADSLLIIGEEVVGGTIMPKGKRSGRSGGRYIGSHRMKCRFI